MSNLADAHSFFLEVGVEELPAGFMSGLEERLIVGIRQKLEAIQLNATDIQVEKTPRRIVISISGLPTVQAEREELIKGPPEKICFDSEGNPSKAFEGFLRKLNAEASQCEAHTIGNEIYRVFKQRIPGKAVNEVIAPLVLEAIMALEGPRFMRWANNTATFPRPIRWLLAFWNDTLLNVELPLGDDVLVSGNTTRGHRLLGEAEFVVHSPADYREALETRGKVMLSTEARKASVLQQLHDRANALEGRVEINDTLMEEVANILEWPTVMTGRFDEKYLSIPKPVLVTVMQAHQRYFAVETNEGILMPYFLVASNGHASQEATIVAGNERVLVARFEDARFFYEEDIKTPLEANVDKLSGITFQKGMGTLKDKTQRIQRLSYAFAEAFALEPATRQHIERAALLCKADLVTSMVFELTELQGEVGMHYALKQGEPSEVAQAIFEHYLPRFQGDELPDTLAGMVVGLADRFDTLVALFSQTNTKMPSGSKDPLGLRRLVNGILLATLAFNLPMNIETWCEHTYHNLGNMAQEPWPETWNRIRAFMQQRLNSYLMDRTYPHDVVKAVEEAMNPWEHLPNFLAKVEALAIKKQDAPDVLRLLYTPANRIDKMISKHYRPEAKLVDVNENLLQEESEVKLYQAACKASISNSTTAMLELAPYVEAFFEHVMVMSEDEAVRVNRINLLSALHRTYLERFGRLSCLILPETTEAVS
jgi:glycyl-tRNA synthetase beta chain